MSGKCLHWSLSEVVLWEDETNYVSLVGRSWYLHVHHYLMCEVFILMPFYATTTTSHYCSFILLQNILLMKNSVSYVYPNIHFFSDLFLNV